MRINAKGQVTIPVKIRREAGLGPGAELEVQYDRIGGYLTVRKLSPPKTKAQRRREMNEWFRSAIGSATANGMTTDEIMKLLRDDD